MYACPGPRRIVLGLEGLPCPCRPHRYDVAQKGFVCVGTAFSIHGPGVVCVVPMTQVASCVGRGERLNHQSQVQGQNSVFVDISEVELREAAAWACDLHFLN
jgi:hypothetical protein